MATGFRNTMRLLLVLLILSSCGQAVRHVSTIVPTPHLHQTWERPWNGYTGLSPVPSKVPTRVLAKRVRPAAVPQPAGQPQSGSCKVSVYSMHEKGMGGTASGIPLDDVTPTIAMRRRDLFGHYVLLTFAGRQVTAQVTDYGPAVSTGRCIDLSPAAYNALLVKTGQVVAWAVVS